jgi:hypothetical protein
VLLRGSAQLIPCRCHFSVWPQVPSHIVRPDYADDGNPVSEVESKQQRAGEAWAGGSASGGGARGAGRTRCRRRRGARSVAGAPAKPATHGCGAHQNPPARAFAPLPAVAVRTAAELAGIRKACLVGREVLDAAHRAVRPGVTTDEIDRVVSAGAGAGTFRARARAHESVRRSN